MRWNIEKGFFFIGIAFLLLSILGLAQTLILSDPLANVDLAQPGSSSGGAVGGSVRIEWYEPDAGLTIRNPFQAISDWKSSPAGMLGTPPLGDLRRRVPLPPLFSGEANAWLVSEAQMPNAIESEE